MLQAYALTSPTVGRALALRALAGLTGPDSANRTAWVHVAYTGEWSGHADGAFELTRESFKSCVDQFNAQANPTPVDFEHASVRDVPDARAAGWVQKLEVRGDDLWALVEWTERAAAMIRAGEYRYCSGVFVFGKPDRKSGKPVSCAIHSIGVTNTPFIDGQRPLALSQRRIALRTGDAMKITREQLMDALKSIEGDEFSKEQLSALLDSIESMAKAQDPKAGEPEEPKPEGEAPAADALAAPLAEEPPVADATALADAAGVGAGGAPESVAPAAYLAKFEELAAKMGTDLEGLIAKIEEMSAGAAPAADPNPAALSLPASTGVPAPALSARVTAQDIAIRALAAKLAKYEAAEAAELAAKAKAERAALDAEVDALVTSGAVLKADIEDVRALAHSDVAQFRKMARVLSARPAVPTGRGASASAPPVTESQSLESVVLDETNPRVVALRASMKAANVSPKYADAAIRKALASA